MEEKVLGISKVTVNRKVTLVKEVMEQLDLKIGDKVLYVMQDGKIILKKA